MKKIKWLILAVFFIGLLTFIVILPKKFYLEDKYYTDSEIIEIDYKNLEELIDKKESFAVLVYQPLCVASSDFESVVDEFKTKNSLKIYKIAYSEIKGTDIGVKYYPSFIIYNKGKRVDFLESDKDEDTNYYTSVKEFTKWFTKYVKLKDGFINMTTSTDENYRNDGEDSENNDNPDPVQDDEQNPNDELSEDRFANEAKLTDIKKEKGKVNIYMFWGNGCPHCAKELEFLDSIKEKYGNLFNLYTFEVWKNKENVSYLEDFAAAMGDEVDGVPYTIIGSKVFSGYKESNNEEIITTIKNNSKKSFDIYFDKIKK